MIPIDQIKKRFELYQKNSKRKALSLRFPWLRPVILSTRRSVNHLRYSLPGFRFSQESKSLPFRLKKHQSILLRKLGESDPQLQINKAVNIKLACQELDGVIIEPGQTFSLWKIIGNATSQKGYVEGMLLAGGEVRVGVGGGLCQLSNLLCWMFLHTPIEIVETYHHSMDSFPDSGRVLPFGSGATIFYNLADLKIKNTHSAPIQIRVWCTDTHLKGDIRSTVKMDYKVKIKEKDHCFVKTSKGYFRYNEIIKEIHKEGILQEVLPVFTNFSPVLYHIDRQYLEKRNYLEVEI